MQVQISFLELSSFSLEISGLLIYSLLSYFSQKKKEKKRGVISVHEGKNGAIMMYNAFSLKLVDSSQVYFIDCCWRVSFVIL